MEVKVEPTVIKPEDIDPHWKWDRPLQAPGHANVDFEERINIRRLHNYRLSRGRQALANSDLGALLCFDNNSIWVEVVAGAFFRGWIGDRLS